MKKNVLLLETVADEALALLQEKTNVFTAFGTQPLPEILESQAIHAVITRGKGQVNQALLVAIPTLEVAARCGVGLDNVDVSAATARNIKVINAPGANAATIAEHTLTLMLMLRRNAYESVAQVKTGNWEWRNRYQGDELAGKTLGILGLGNIGLRVARLAEAFGMRVVYCNRSEKHTPYLALPLKEVLQQADIVSLHLPLTPATDEILGEKELALMAPNALLINTARGSLVNPAALLKALDAGALAGYGADVLTIEPPAPDDLLVQHPRTLITPHVGSLTTTTYVQMCVQTVQNVLAVLDGEPPVPESIFNRHSLKTGLKLA